MNIAIRPWVGILALVGATLAWAGNFLLGGAAVGEMGVLSLAWMRWAIAVVPLFVIAHFVEKPDWRLIARNWPRIVLLAICGLAIYNIMLYLSLGADSAVNASLINSVNPALIAVAAAIFLRSRVGVRGVCGIALAFFGVVWILTSGSPQTILDNPPSAGSLFMLVAICAWTAYTILGRTGPKLPPIASVAAQALVVTVGLAPFALGSGLDLPSSSSGWAALAYIAVFPSIVSYVLWNTALQVIPAPRAGVFLNLITVFTVLGAVLLGTPLTIEELIGGVLVLAGVALTTNWRHRPAVNSPASQRSPGAGPGQGV
ncbi:drug/metabolite transporter (DMT)-like permease [Leucobacter exalbidus]|uniref:Drug/metabolite transporter (DMT)-like permease n=1 Tax=Leucobacter exalbidus TaxID=662960 RepID=A0A940T375_9MICO|nr:drug/metabolite transporter (DMT)-like permease [Leucobacter exalbidus]